MFPSRHGAARRIALVLRLACAAALAGGAAAASAQPAAAEAARVYDLPAGPLGDVLNRIAGQAGLSLGFSPAQVAGKTSAPVRGRYPAHEAIATALAGTGLQLQAGEAGGYTLREIPPGSPAVTAPGPARRSPWPSPTSSATSARACTGRTR